MALAKVRRPGCLCFTLIGHHGLCHAEAAAVVVHHGGVVVLDVTRGREERSRIGETVRT